jgi:methyl-accepting chemotaxis protein
MFGAGQSKQIRDAVSIVKRAAAGDFEARMLNINAGGDLGELFNSINDLIDRCDAYIRESAAAMEHVGENMYFRRIIETGMQGSFLTASQSVNGALGAMQTKVVEFGSVADSFESTVASVVASISDASNELSGSSRSMGEIAEQSGEKANEMTSATKQMSSNLEAVAAASEELTASIGQIGQQVEFATTTAEQAKSATQSVGREIVLLEEAAGQIENAVGLITDIAAQTNLLALNATIEAARAGDAGRGFAVVANEVKNLAQQSSDATDEIRKYVENIQAATENTVTGIDNVSEKVIEIETASSSVSSSIQEQSAATAEIAENIERATVGAREVAVNIVDVNQSTQKTGAAATNVNSAATQLLEQSDTLSGVVDDFLKTARTLA